MPFYRAGKTVTIKASAVTDVTLRVFVNDEEIPLKFYEDHSLVFEFEMPAKNTTIHLTHDPFYGKDEYGFNELHSWVNYTKKPIVKVAIKTVDYSDKNSFIVTQYSTKQSNINGCKSIFDQRFLKLDRGETTSKSFSTELIFFYDDGQRYSIHFRDEYLYWNDFSSWRLFKLKNPEYALPTLENPILVTYSFRRSHEKTYIKSYEDKWFSSQYSYLTSIEFVPYSEPEINAKAVYYLDTEYGKLNILTPTVFELNGKYYEIVSGKDRWAYTYLAFKS